METIDYEAEATGKSRRNFSTGKCRSRRNPKRQHREEADEIRKQAQEQGQAEGLEQGMQEGAAVYDAKLESIGKREAAAAGFLSGTDAGTGTEACTYNYRCGFPCFPCAVP